MARSSVPSYRSVVAAKRRATPPAPATTTRDADAPSAEADATRAFTQRSTVAPIPPGYARSVNETAECFFGVGFATRRASPELSTRRNAQSTPAEDNAYASGTPSVASSNAAASTATHADSAWPPSSARDRSNRHSGTAATSPRFVRASAMSAPRFALRSRLFRSLDSERLRGATPSAFAVPSRRVSDAGPDVLVQHETSPSAATTNAANGSFALAKQQIERAGFPASADATGSRANSAPAAKSHAHACPSLAPPSVTTTRSLANATWSIARRWPRNDATGRCVAASHTTRAGEENENNPSASNPVSPPARNPRRANTRRTRTARRRRRRRADSSRRPPRERSCRRRRGVSAATRRARRRSGGEGGDADEGGIVFVVSRGAEERALAIEARREDDDARARGIGDVAVRGVAREGAVARRARADHALELERGGAGGGVGAASGDGLRFDADGIVEGTRRRFRDARFTATREGEANEPARTADGAGIERRAPTERDAGGRGTAPRRDVGSRAVASPPWKRSALTRGDAVKRRRAFSKTPPVRIQNASPPFFGAARARADDSKRASIRPERFACPRPPVPPPVAPPSPTPGRDGRDPRGRGRGDGVRDGRVAPLGVIVAHVASMLAWCAFGVYDARRARRADPVAGGRRRQRRRVVRGVRGDEVRRRARSTGALDGAGGASRSTPSRSRRANAARVRSRKPRTDVADAPPRPVTPGPVSGMTKQDDPSASDFDAPPRTPPSPSALLAGPRQRAGRRSFWFCFGVFFVLYHLCYENIIHKTDGMEYLSDWTFVLHAPAFP